MVWQDRIKDAAFTSPSGVRTVFDVEAVSVTTDKKITTHTYPFKTGAFNKDMHPGARRFPIKAFIHGADYTVAADAFYNSLEEVGPGTLEHPLYGVYQVVPVSISRVDMLVDGAGQAVFEIEFVEDKLDPFPISSYDAVSVVQNLSDQHASLGAEQLEENFSEATPSQLQLFSSKMKECVGFVQQYVRPVLVTNGIATKTFDDVARGLQFAGNIGTGDVRAVSVQLNTLIRSGASAQAGAPAAYVDLTNALINLNVDHPQQFDVVNYAAESSVNALAQSTSSNQYDSRREAIDTADAMAGTFNDYVVWKDANG